MTMMTPPQNNALALPPGFTEPESADAYAEQQAKVKRDAEKRAGDSGGPKIDFYEIPKPTGQEGSETVTIIRVLPHHSRDLTKPFYRIVYKHAEKIFNEETQQFEWVIFQCRETIGERCIGTEAKIRLFQRSNEVNEEKKPKRESDSPIRQHAKSIGARKVGLFQVIVVSDAGRHFDREANTLKPSVLRDLPTGLTNELLKLEAERGMLAHPTRGFLVKIICKKTGPNKNNIDYSVIGGDREAMDPSWYPIFDNLYDLDLLVKVPATDAAELGILRRAFPRAFSMYDDLEHSPVERKPADERGGHEQSFDRTPGADVPAGGAAPGMGAAPGGAGPKSATMGAAPGMGTAPMSQSSGAFPGDSGVVDGELDDDGPEDDIPF